MIRAFIKAPAGRFALAIIAGLVLIVIVGPRLTHAAASAPNFDAIRLSPRRGHLLGTDGLGRDIFSRLVVAARLSIGLSVIATLLGAGIGMTFGAGAVLLPGRARSVALRTIDSLLAFPAVLVAIFIGAILGAGARSATIGLAFGLSFYFARVTSNLALSLAGREYVHAARITGIRGPRLLFRHVLPNAGETLAITTTVAFSSSIVALSTLSFLGLGVQPPAYDWGSLLTQGVQDIYQRPAGAVGPASAIAIVALAFGFLGEALARAMNPMLWRSSRPSLTSLMPIAPEIAVEEGESHLVEEMEGALSVPEEQDSVQGDEAVSGPVISNQAHLAPPMLSAVRPEAPTEETENVLEVRALSVSFPGASSRVDIVKDISFSVAHGEMVGIAGESGSGKTMTAMAVAGLVSYPGIVNGTVRLAGCDIATAAPREARSTLIDKLAVVFQDPMSSLNPALTIGTQMTEAVEFHRGMSHKAALALAEQRLREVNIPAPRRQLSRYPHELSGGMRQRVVIAMGLMNTPALLIADEPTTSLDLTIQAQLMELFHQINEDHGVAILLISHNLGLLSQNCSRVVTMYAGRMIEDGPANDVLLDPLHPYTRGLIAAVPKMERARSERLQAIPGLPPEFHAMPDGCPYHPRCPFAIERCTTETPPLRMTSTGRMVACWVASPEEVVHA